VKKNQRQHNYSQQANYGEKQKKNSVKNDKKMAERYGKIQKIQN
jgi:hypothetical protein